MAARTKSKGRAPAPSADGRETVQQSTSFSEQHGEMVVRDQRIFRRGQPPHEAAPGDEIADLVGAPDAR